MNVILLSGGSGKRLWPLSNDVRSKQFLKIFRKADGTRESMVQRMYRMIKEVDPDGRITIATSENQIPQIRAQLGGQVGISAEPTGRDTFPAIALAAAYLKKQGVGEDAAVVACPVDPYVEADYFECLKELSDAAEKADAAKLTLMGIEPAFPSENYGYIIPLSSDHVAAVKEFKEKPDEETAKKYIAEGALWNGGVFAFRLSYVLDIAAARFGTDSYDELFRRYDALPKVSFDYAVVEGEKSMNAVRFPGPWKELGTWNTLTEAMDEEVAGNAACLDCQNTHVINELGIPVIALGVKDCIIAATPDGILVSDKAKSPGLRPFATTSRPMDERRGWGEYRVLDCKLHQDQHNSLVRELILAPGQRIGFQGHQHTTGVWTFTEGTGELTTDVGVKAVSRGAVAVIKPGTGRAIKALTELHIIEVLIGDEPAEDDIERPDRDGWSSPE